jgi:hypothetical protein
VRGAHGRLGRQHQSYDALLGLGAGDAGTDEGLARAPAAAPVGDREHAELGLAGDGDVLQRAARGRVGDRSEDLVVGVGGDEEFGAGGAGGGVAQDGQVRVPSAAVEESVVEVGAGGDLADLVVLVGPGRSDCDVHAEQCATAAARRPTPFWGSGRRAAGSRSAVVQQQRKPCLGSPSRVSVRLRSKARRVITGALGSCRRAWAT